MGESATIRLATSGSVDDLTLVTAFRNGDRRAFELLVRRHQKVVWAVALRISGQQSDAEDIAQKAFITAMERISELRGSFRPWLLQITANLAKNYRRDKARLVLADTDEPPTPAHHPRPDDELHSARLSARLRQAVLALPARQREVTLLRIDAQLSFAEIAETLGVTENNAKVAFHTATKKLRETLGGIDAL